MSVKKKLASITLALVMTLMISLPLLAQTWLAYYPTIIIDSSGGARTAVPVITGIEGQGLIDGGVLSASGMDSRMRLASTDIPYMLSTTQISTYLATLPAFGQAQVDLYAGYSVDATDFDIISGTDGYITIDDDATLELGSDFEIEQSGYVDTSDSNFAYLEKKRGAYSNPITDVNEISGVVYLDEPEELIPSGFNAWTDVDVSAYVPGHATGIVVHLTNTAGAARDVGVRMNGSVDALVGDLQTHSWSIVGIDASDIFDLFLEDATCHAYLVGFTGSDFTFKVVADDISAVGALAWEDIDISAEAPNATGAIIVVLNTHIGNNFDWGVRKKGSGDNRWEQIIASGISWAVIGCDTSQVIEGYVGALDVDFYLVGYTTNNVTFFTNGIDKSLAAGLGMWTDIDCSGDVTGFTTHIIFEVLSDAALEYGFRRNGSTEDIHSDITWHFWVIVECDEDQIVQGWAEAINVDWFIIGYIEGYIDNPYDVSATATGIASGEYTVKTYGVANEPAWATGDVLHFTGANDSNVNAGAINDNIAQLWVSLWFNLDSTFSAASGTDQFIWGKFNGAADYVYAYLESDDGILYFQFDDGVNPFTLTSTTVSWTADTGYHIITSLSDDPAQRLLVNDTAEDTDAVAASNTPNGGDFIFGDFDDPGAVTGFIGEIQNVIVGTDNLTADEETALFAGTAPGDETEYWYTDEGTGTAITNYGSAGAGSDGNVDNAPTWETATFTTGKTGRLCDFYIEVDDGVTDPDRWGANLKGASVAANGNDWILNQNNVMPWMDYYYHTVAGVLHAWYQPNYMVQSTSYDGTADAGGTVNTLVDAELVQANDYWNNALLTITDTTDDLAPEGETSVVTDFDAGTDTLTFSPALTVAPDAGDTYTVDFATLIDRSYYALDFDGINDQVSMGDVAVLDFEASDSFTIIAWVRTDSLVVNQGIVIKGQVDAAPGAAFQGYSLRIQSNVVWGKVQDVDNNITTSHTTAFTTAPFVMVSMVVDRSADTLVVYHNEVASTTADISSIGDLTNADEIVISGYPTNPGYVPFDGIIDEVWVYNRALEQAEITYNYNGGAGRYVPYSTTNLVGQWHIETGTGVGAIIVDSSGEGSTGTLVGATWINGKVPRPAGNSGTNDSRLTWGVNSAITLVYGEPVNYTTTSSALSGEGGYTVAEADMPAEWYGTAGNIANLPLYDMFLPISVDTGIPVQTLYVFMITGLSFAFAIAGFVMFNSVMAAIVGIGLALGIGSAMTVVPLWIFFAFLILAIGIAYLKGRAVLG